MFSIEASMKKFIQLLLPLLLSLPAAAQPQLDQIAAHLQTDRISLRYDCTYTEDTPVKLSGVLLIQGDCCLPNIFFEDRSGHIFEDDTLARLISMPNVIVTSHQAFLTQEALTNIAHTTLGNIEEYLKTGKSANEVKA